MARERKSYPKKRRGQKQLLGISNKFKRATDRWKKRQSILKTALAKDWATASQVRGSPSSQISLAKRRSMLPERKSCLSSTPASALKKRQKRLDRTRQKDKSLRDRMFLRNDPHPCFPAADNDCILIEKVTEVIVLDDDDDEKHGKQSISEIQEKKACSEGETDTPNRMINQLSGERSLNAREDTEVTSTTDAKPAEFAGEYSGHIRNNLADKSKSNRIEDQTNANEMNDSSDIIEIMSLNENTLESTCYADNCKTEVPRNSQEALAEVPDQNLFFEDTTGNCLVDRRDIPVYESLFTRDIYKKPALSANDGAFVSSTPIASIKTKKKKKRKQFLDDDSVIFISEEPAPSTAEDIIKLSVHSSNEKYPLETQQQQNANRQRKKMSKRNSPAYVTPPQKKQRRNDELFTTSEQKRIQAYNSNTYNPDKIDLTPGKRMVIIDGSNVAYSHSRNKEFSVKGIEIAIAYFEKMEHEVKVVIPQHRLRKSKSSDPEKLEKLYGEGKIVFTPCKALPGMSSTSYDDRFILQLAAEFDAAIVSNDNYRDLLVENAAFKKIIEARVIGYTWCNDLFMLPKDPYGRHGPSLSVILNRL